MHRKSPEPSMIRGSAGYAMRGDQLLPAVLPMRRHIRARFIEVHMLIDMVDPGYRDEVMMLAIGRALFGQLDLVGTLEMIDLSDGLSIRRNDVHMFLDQRSVGHVSSSLNA
jgi:hypothetical protein